jgi:hypothetical protein
MPKKKIKKKATAKRPKKPEYTAKDWAFKVDNEGGLAEMVGWGGANCVDNYDLDQEFKTKFKEFSEIFEELQAMAEDKGYTL